MTDIIDPLFSKDAFSDMQLKQALLDEQALITKELQANQDVIPLPYNPNTTVLRIPKISTNSAFTITLAPEHCRTRQVIFGAFNAAKYLYCTTDNFSENRKHKLTACRHAWRYLDVISFTDENRATWLKDYESWRVSEDGVKTQSTGIYAIKLVIKDALSFSGFTDSLTDFEREYLVTLANTHAAPWDEADGANLNQWFSRHTWLRRDDIGIGHELYIRLGSPKALMNSFRITIENALLHLQTCKDALIESFRLAGITFEDIPLLADIVVPNGRRKQHYIRTAKTQMLNRLRQKLVPLIDYIPNLRHALELVVFTEALPQFRKEIFNTLLANQPIKTSLRNRATALLTSTQETGLFDAGFLRQLAFHAALSPENDGIPVSQAESLLFSYLMAYQTVQGSDIPRITLRDFKFVRRINGAVTHIESDYFKSRAKSNVHQVETLKTKDDIGKAVFRYIKDVTALKKLDKPLTPALKKDACAPPNVTGLLFLACTDTALWHVINDKHQTQHVAAVFPKAMQAMLCIGVQRTQTPLETPIPQSFFGFAHIKTSAVYAGSDSFDPASLINPRSHTNKTERDSYLVEMNLEWQNNCGRITRAVMRDLYVNVFTARESDKQLFESEFTKAVEHIKARTNNVLACLKFVTQQTSGHVDELGFVNSGVQIESDLPDTIYIQDSPETVVKLKHFLAQLQEKHTLLRECAPEFLFLTALPTAEWIESLLDNKRFSKASLDKGQELFDKYQSHLPPHFTAHLS